MSLRLPSRYEDLDPAFRGRLKPNADLLKLVQTAFSSVQISGGIRFIPIYGQSGSGKTCAALELGTHLPELYVQQSPRHAIEDPNSLNATLDEAKRSAKGRRIVAVIDQYEEVAAQRSAVPTAFVETLSLLDRKRSLVSEILFLWLTTSRDFQAALSNATNRNQRILVSKDFELPGLPTVEWPSVISETFQFHNGERTLADYEILDADLIDLSESSATIGAAIEITGTKLAKFNPILHDLSTYQVVMLWPVTDGLRITRIQQFTDPRQGYRVDWNSVYRQMNQDDQQQLPVREYNRARLYFDMRLVPVAAADLHPLCRDLEKADIELGRSYLDRFKSTHFFSIVAGTWDTTNYAPLRERESKRANEAEEWYATVTDKPTLLGRRIAKCFEKSGVTASYEKTIYSPHSKVRADVLVNRTHCSPPNVLIELKAYAPENTMPSTICSAIQTTLRRHAQFAGFLNR